MLLRFASKSKNLREIVEPKDFWRIRCVSAFLVLTFYQDIHVNSWEQNFGLYSRNMIATHKTWNDGKTSADNNYLGTKNCTPADADNCLRWEQHVVCVWRKSDYKRIVKLSTELQFVFFSLFTIANGRRYILHRTHTQTGVSIQKQKHHETHAHVYLHRTSKSPRVRVDETMKINTAIPLTHTRTQAPHTVVRRDNTERRAYAQTTQRIKGIERINRTSVATYQNEFRLFQCK